MSALDDIPLAPAKPQQSTGTLPSDIPLGDTTLKDNYDSASKVNPDHAAKALRVSKETGLNPQYVLKNQDKFNAQPDFDELDKNYPNTGKYLRDRANMSKSHDDIENLTQHEQIANHFQIADSIPKAIKMGLENSILAMSFRGKESGMTFGKDSTFAQKVAGQAASLFADFPYMAAGGVIGAAAGSPLGPGGAAVAGYGGSFALPDAVRHALQEHIRNGDVDSTADLIKKTFSFGTLKAGLKGFGIGALTGGAGKAAAVFGPVASGAAELATMTAAGAAAEGQVPTMEDVASNSVLMGLMHGAGKIGGYAMKKTFPERVSEKVSTDIAQQSILAQDEAIKASKLRQRDPEGFANFVDTLNIPKPMVDVAKFDQHFESKGIDPSKAAEQLGISSAYQEAKATGDHIVIPQSAYTRAEFDEHRLALAPDTKFSSEALTPTQFQEEEKVRSEIKKAAEEGKPVEGSQPNVQSPAAEAASELLPGASEPPVQSGAGREPLPISVTEHPIFVKSQETALPVLNEAGIHPEDKAGVIKLYRDIHGQMHDLLAEAKSKPAPERLSEIAAQMNAIGAKEAAIIRHANILSQPDTWLPFYEMRDQGNMEAKAPQNVMEKFLGEQTPLTEREDATRKALNLAGQELGQTTLKAAEANPKASEQLLKLQKAARAEAEKILMQPQLEEIKASTRDMLEKERERLTQEIGNQVNQEPIFKALSLLNLGPKKQEMWFHANDYMNDKLSAENKTAFNMIAEMSGFSSGDEMARTMLLTDPKDAFKSEVKKRVDLEMGKFSNLKDTDAMREEALKAVHNEKQSELLALEQQIMRGLRDKVEVNDEVIRRRKEEAKLAADAAKNLAETYLENQPIQDAGAFRRFYTAERNAAVRYAKALAKGDYVAAEQAKGEQLNSHALATESIRLRNNIVRWVNRLNTERTVDAKTYKTAEHFYQAAELLRRFGLDREDFRPSMRDETLAQWSARMEEKTSIVDIPDWLQNERLEKPYRDLSVGQLRDLKNAIANIKHVANFEDTAFTIFDKADLGEVANKLIAEQQANAAQGKTPSLSMKESFMDKVIKSKDEMLFQLIAPETWLRKFDGYKNFGPWWKALYEHYARGADVKAKMLVEAADHYSKIWGEYSPKEKEAMGEKIYIPEIGDSLMKSEILTMALNTGSEINMQRLIEGRDWRPEQVKAILDREMTKRDWDTIQKTWDFIDSYWPKISELYKELTGFSPEKIEAKPFMAQFDEYRGGYYPKIVDSRVEVRGSTQMDVDASLSSQQPAWRASTKNGFTKKSVEGAKYKVSLDINGIQRHITDVVHDLTMRKWVLDANRLLARKDIQASIVDGLGMGGYKMFNDWVKAVAGTNDFQSREYLGDFIHGVRSHTVIANLGLRVASVVLQADDIGAYGSVDPTNFGAMDAGNAVVGFYGKLITDPSRYQKSVDFVYEKSKYMKYERGENLDRDIKEAARREWGSNDTMGKVSMSLVTGVDHLLSIPVWIEAYKKGIELHNGDDQMATDYADNIIRRAQASGRLGELPAIMRGSEKQKALTMFYSFMNKRLNLWYEALDRTKDINDLPRLAGTAMAMWIVPTLFSSFVHNGVPTTKEKQKKYMKDILLYPTSLFPVIRDVADFAMDKAMGLPSFGYSPTPMARGVEAAGEFIGKIANWKKTRTQKKLEAGARVASYVAPYPSQINDWIFNLADYVNHGMTPQIGDLLRRRPTRERR